MENISKFLKAALDFGCVQADLFQTVELHEGRDMGQVNCLRYFNFELNNCA